MDKKSYLRGFLHGLSIHAEHIIRDDHGAVLPIHSVCNHPLDKTQVLKFLLEHFPVNQGDDEGCNPLHIVCKRGYDLNSYGPILIEAGCDVNERDDSGKIPLHYACEMDAREDNRIERIEYLLKAKANPTITDQHGRSPFWYLMIDDDDGLFNRFVYTASVRLMLEHGADPNTPYVFHHAILNQHYISRMLYEFGARIPDNVKADHPNWHDIRQRNILKCMMCCFSVSRFRSRFKVVLYEDLVKRLKCFLFT